MQVGSNHCVYLRRDWEGELSKKRKRLAKPKQIAKIQRTSKHSHISLDDKLNIVRRLEDKSNPISQRALAKEIGISSTAVSNIFLDRDNLRHAAQTLSKITCFCFFLNF